jgi:hypothetical protein
MGAVQSFSGRYLMAPVLPRHGGRFPVQKSRMLHKSQPIDRQGLFLCGNDVQKFVRIYLANRIIFDTILSG